MGEFGFVLFAPNQAAGKTRVWIRRLPKLLFFQLQRVAFDPETKAQSSILPSCVVTGTGYMSRVCCHLGPYRNK